jgi:ABC-type sugar transport system ATPase subunit
MKVTLQNITKKFGSTIAVNDFTASLTDGHLICLLGPSGCGKTTILNMLCGITKVTQGKIFFDDVDVTDLPPDQRGIGMVFQNYALYPHMTVLENIAFPLEVQKISKKIRNEKALEIAKLVHVENLVQRFPSELSGGQQQRVAIARALIKNPKLLLMDEPLSNLDARLRLEMREEIRRIQKETGVTTVFVTHDQDEAMAISDSILLMKDGFFIQEGLSQELYNNPNCKFTSDFLGNPPINQIHLKKNELEIENPGWKISCGILYKDKEKIELPEEYTLSVRAESFDFCKDGKISADTESVVELGKERFAYLHLFNTSVRAFIYDEEEINEGEKVSFNFRKRGVFIFNTKTGERLM